MNTIKKINLICPTNFRASLLNAAKTNKLNVADYSYHTLPNNKLLRKIIGKIGFFFELYSFISFNSSLFALLVNYNYTGDDLILVIRGHYLSLRNKRILNIHNLRNIIVWSTDSIKRHKSQNGILKYSSLIYLHDGGDIKLNNQYWMPFAFDEGIYYESDSLKDIDISLIGNIYSNKYLTRLNYLLKIIEAGLTEKYTCLYIGRVTGIINRLKLYKFRKSNLQRLDKISNNLLAQYIRRSKICINILQDDGLMPINPMFFAIPACGTCMLTEKKPYFDFWLRENIDYVSVTKDNLLNVLDSLLNNEERIRTIETAGQNFAKGNSFAQCLKRVLNDYQTR